ncbi:hypothetical protein WDW37_02505 [Bdellovibrionota bacterium FG-1]
MRSAPFLLLSLLVLAATAHADDLSGMIDLTPLGVIQTFQVTAPRVCPAVPAPPPVPLAELCEPDPYEKLCENIPPEVVRRQKELTKFAQAVDQQVEQFITHVETAHQKSPTSKKLNEEEQEKWKTHHRLLMLAEIEKPQKSKVLQTLKKAKELFMTAIGKRKYLHPKELAVLGQYLEGCAKNPGLWNQGPERHNGWNKSFREWNNPLGEAQLLEAEDDKLPVGSTGATCKLYLNPMTWRECAEGTEVCYFYLFHEFAHSLNSCLFLKNQKSAQAYKKEASEDFTDRFQAFRAQFLKKTEKHDDDMTRLLIQSTACLEILSAPHDAIPNACPREQTRLDDLLQKRCSVGALSPYPSQWEEAEADFWAGTALAQYFESQANLDLGAKRKVFQRIATSWCIDDSAQPFSTPSPTETPLDIYEEASQEPSCEDLPANPKMTLPPKWGDSHQDTTVRFNRNFLRNSDLRRALGCSTTSPAVAMSCSPLGKKQSWLPTPTR